jgi:hypothetical protein
MRLDAKRTCVLGRAQGLLPDDRARLEIDRGHGPERRILTRHAKRRHKPGEKRTVGRTGLRVDRSSIIRRALTQHIEIVRISGKEKDK